MLPRTGPRSARKVAAVLAVAATSTALLAPAASAVVAKPKDVPYLLAAVGYGSQINADTVGLSSGPTGYTTIGCPHSVGRSGHNYVAEVGTSQTALVSGVSSTTSTFRSGGKIGSQSVNNVAKVSLGTKELNLTLTGLSGTSRAWAQNGHFNASSTFNLGDVTLGGSDLLLALPGTPLGSISGLLNGPVSAIKKQLVKGPITIPGFARLQVGGTTRTVSANGAKAGSIALLIQVFGADRKMGTSDDVKVVVGRSVAGISKYRQQPIFGGEAYSSQATLLGGLAALGKNIDIPMPCQGTGGKVDSGSLATVNLGGQLVLEGVASHTYGKLNASRKGGSAYTTSSIGHIVLGGSSGLTINAIRAVAKVTRDNHRKLHRSSSQTIGSITAAGKTYTLPKPGSAITIPGIAIIAVPAPTSTASGVKVTTLRLSILDGTAVQSVINLGNAAVSMHY